MAESTGQLSAVQVEEFFAALRSYHSEPHLASDARTTVENLKSWNGLRGTRIAAGDLLTIYTTKKF